MSFGVMISTTIPSSGKEVSLDCSRDENGAVLKSSKFAKGRDSDANRKNFPLNSSAFITVECFVLERQSFFQRD